MVDLSSERAATGEPATGKSQRLGRTLGASDGAALVVSTVVGVGIFTTPGIVAEMVPGPLAFLGVWLLGGLLALAGALAYAELAATYPEAGGEYVYLREAFGPLAGFLSGWTSFIAGFSGAIAAGAVGFAAYLGRFVPAASDTRPLLTLPVSAVEVSPRTLVAVGVIALFTLAHLWGSRPGWLIQNVLAALVVFTLALLIAAGFGTSGATLQPVARAGGPVGDSWLLALIPVMFTYSGWNATAYVAGEVRDPGHNIPRALAAGTIAVILLYLSLNLLYLQVLTPAELHGAIATGGAVAEALFGSLGTAVFTLLALLALASGVSAMIVTGPRVYYAMARGGALPSGFGRLRSGSGVPAVAIIAQGVWSGVLVVSGTFEALLMYTGFAIVLFAGAAVTALFVLRRRHPHKQRPYTVPGYPLVPGAFVAVSAAMALEAVRTAPLPSIMGLLLILAGVPMYLWCSHRRTSERAY